MGPVVATALLMVVAVAAVVGFQTWFQGYSSSLFTQTETQGNDLTTGIERVVGESLYFKSNKNNLSISKVEIGGEDCDFQNSTQKGISKIDISSCLNSASSDTAQEAVVYTDQGIYSEEFIVDFQNGESSNFFISVWNTSESGISNSNQIAFPLTATGTYNFTVFGDNLVGSPVRITSSTQNVLNFTIPGVHEITIEGEIVGWKFTHAMFSEPDSDNFKIYEIKQWGPLRLEDTGGYFFHTRNLIISATDPLNLSGVTNLSSMFEMIFSSNFNVTGTINNWDTSQIVDMSSMFNSAYDFNSPLNEWNVSNVEDMSSMFNNAETFNQPLENWDTSQVTTMRSMFESDHSYLNMSFNQDISMWDVSNVVNMVSMFDGVVNFNQPLNSWNVSNLKNMGYMFSDAKSFNQPLNSWNVSSPSNMGGMFDGAKNFNQSLNSWNVTNVTYMHETFSEAVSFNQPLDNWDVSNVEWFSNMFLNATSFNQNLSSWDVSSVTTCTDFDLDATSWVLSNSRPALDPSCLS